MVAKVNKKAVLSQSRSWSTSFCWISKKLVTASIQKFVLVSNRIKYWSNYSILLFKILNIRTAPNSFNFSFSVSFCWINNSTSCSILVLKIQFQLGYNKSSSSISTHNFTSTSKQFWSNFADDHSYLTSIMPLIAYLLVKHRKTEQFNNLTNVHSITLSNYSICSCKIITVAYIS